MSYWTQLLKKFISGSILFGNANGSFGEDNANLSWDNINKVLTLNGKHSIGPTAVSFSNDGANFFFTARVSSNSSTDRPVFAAIRSRGTLSVPLTLVGGDLLYDYSVQGFEGSVFQTSALMRFGTTGTIAAGRVPSYIAFYTSPDAVGGAREVARLTENGALTLALSTGVIYERARTTPLGEWIDVPYNAANFTASVGTWDVEAGDQIEYSYSIVGKTMFLKFRIQTTNVSNASQLRVAIPGGFVLGGNDLSLIGASRISDAGGPEIVTAFSLPGGQPHVEFSSNPGGGNFTPTTGHNTNIAAMLFLELA